MLLTKTNFLKLITHISGDQILSVNGVALDNLTIHESLTVLKSQPTNVRLHILPSEVATLKLGLYTIHYTLLYIINSMLYIIHCTMYIIHYTCMQGCKSVSSIGRDDQHILVNFLILGG